MVNLNHDPFADILDLEDKYYQEGFDLGVKDGSRAGLIEGCLFGIEKGYEKYAAMGRLQGQAIAWAGRLPTLQAKNSDAIAQQRLKVEHMTNMPGGTDIESKDSCLRDKQGRPTSSLPQLPATARLEKHVRTLYALVESSSLPTKNDEDSVSQFDDRLKRAEGKAKIIGKRIGEVSSNNAIAGFVPSTSPAPPAGSTEKGEASIEDVSVLYARH